MKELVEMAAYIEGEKTRQWAQQSNDDALQRAKGIRLPD